jgi:hypothetical protein
MMPQAVWLTLFTKHHEAHPHILLVANILLSMAFSSSTVERGFSMVNRLADLV